jgi:tetratricopeptide (TPR) repeat protein
MRALDIGPICLLALIAFAPAAYAECSPTDLSAAEQSYSTARVLADAGQWADAIPALERALDSCPEHLASIQLIAFAEMQSKNYGAAGRYFQAQIDLQFDGVTANADLNTLRPFGFVLLQLGNWTAAVRVYESILEHDPENAEAHERLVYAYDKSGNTTLAIPHLEALFHSAATDEDQQKMAKRIGAAYKKIGEDGSAKEWYALAGGGASGQFTFGLEHMNRKEWGKAAESFESYVEGQPTSVSALKNLGICYDQLGRKADAAATYGKAYELAPERPDIAASLALAYSDLERWTDVAAIVEPAVANWPETEASKGAMYYLMGKVYEKRDGDYESAISMFEKARSDAHWGSFAAREIERQQQLIAIRDARKG